MNNSLTRVNFSLFWKQTKKVLRKLLTCKKMSHSTWHDIITNMNSVCNALPRSYSDDLCMNTRDFLHRHVCSLLKNMKSTSKDNLLKNYQDCWLKYSQGLTHMDTIYRPLIEYYTKLNKIFIPWIPLEILNMFTHKKMSIKAIGLQLWEDNIQEHFSNVLCEQLVECFSNDQKLALISPGVVKNVMNSFLTVEQYSKNVCTNLSQRIIDEYHKVEANRLLKECSVSAYMKQVLLIQQVVQYKIDNIPLFISKSKMKESFHNVLIIEQLPLLVNEFKQMMQDERIQDLADLFQLLHIVPSVHERLVDEFREYVKQIGVAEIGVSTQENGVRYVENVLSVYKKYKRYISEVFNNDSKLVYALDKSFKYVFKHDDNHNKSTKNDELLVKYCDSLLRIDGEQLSERETDDKITDVVFLFRYSENKDVFGKGYAQLLAKRLINQRSIGVTAEKLVVKKLEEICGRDFTANMYHLIDHLFCDNELNNKFANYSKPFNLKLGMDFSVNVLKNSSWPFASNEDEKFVLPEQLTTPLELFKCFYCGTFKRRQLSWQFQQSQTKVKLTCLKKSYLITMSIPQLVILLLFDKSDSLITKDIRKSLQLSLNTFRRHIIGIVNAKLLLSDSTEVTDDSVLRFNLNYANEETEFLLTAADDSQREKKQALKVVEDDRTDCVEAIIMKIMKSKKVLRHKYLIEEVLKQTKKLFVPQISMIKMCIESLINKDYVARRPNSEDEYLYLEY